ncbi:related to DAL3 - ureidoglycolate hydrolase [Cephalotrichum gorgonifer]|uniref:Related to DAL3 - ureidoglycolate hydrolase n=1 Tax=Cephalotrichum gorgonifer TaxID=2041049 RepID=A0AAE8SUD1_9PEZI|nr:related to DAL3 - ureidoglycolate hydrolase [Cephalotrichum gorgonifer]
MPLQISIGHLSLTIPAKPLTPSAFSPYGDVIQNPRSNLLPPATQSTLSSLPFDPVSANQGSAIKYQHVSRPRDLYSQAPSRIPSQPAMNMFVCRERPLIPAHELKLRTDGDNHLSAQTSSDVDLTDSDAGFLRDLNQSRKSSYFNVSILERHPFTTQTFIPITPEARYLVIVAPSLPSPSYPALPTPSRGSDLPGPGLPDISRMEAFVATGGQAVTYGAGTWHAPMVVLEGRGEKVDFVVVQFQNGVPREDCQEVVLQSEDAEAGVLVEVKDGGVGEGIVAKIRAKL